MTWKWLTSAEPEKTGLQCQNESYVGGKWELSYSNLKGLTRLVITTYKKIRWQLNRKEHFQCSRLSGTSCQPAEQFKCAWASSGGNTENWVRLWVSSWIIMMIDNIITHIFWAWHCAENLAWIFGIISLLKSDAALLFTPFYREEKPASGSPSSDVLQHLNTPQPLLLWTTEVRALTHQLWQLQIGKPVIPLTGIGCVGVIREELTIKIASFTQHWNPVDLKIQMLVSHSRNSD